MELSLSPDKGSDHLKEISIVINRINSLNSDVDTNSYRIDIDSMANALRFSVDRFKSVFPALQRPEEMDSLVTQLYQIDRLYEDVRELKKERASWFVGNLEDKIGKQYTGSLSKRDSVVIQQEMNTYTNRQRQEISNSRRLSPDLRKDLEALDDRTFFQRLFGSGRGVVDSLLSDNDKGSDTVSQREMAGSNRGAAVAERDSVLFSVAADIYQIRENFNHYSQIILAREGEIAELNNTMHSTFERVFRDYTNASYNQFQRNVSEIRQGTSGYVRTLFAVVMVFIVGGLIMLYRFIREIDRNNQFQKQLEISEKQANIQAEERLKFLNMMSHELRTPLTSVIGYIDQMDQRNPDVVAAKSASDYLFQLTNEILDVAKIRAGNLDLSEEPGDLTDILNNIRNSFEPAIIQKGLEAVFDFPEEAIYVRADFRRLQQILYNLLQNAMKFTDHGHIALRCKANKQGGEVQVRIEIEDSGAGISKEEQETMFEAYKQVGTHKNKQLGTGLGLGLVKQLVELFQGELRVQSEPGQGTVFSLSFVLPEALPDEVKAVQSPDNEPGTDWLKGIKLFVLDDDKLIADLYEKLLRNYGAEVTVFNHPNSAFHFLRQKAGAYKLMIFDHKMPGMSGSELVEKLREIPDLKMPKIILSSADVMLTDDDIRRTQSFDAFIIKPIDKRQLIATIAELLDIPYGDEASMSEGFEPSSKERSFSFEKLQDYIGDDREELLAMVHYLAEENAKELEALHRALQKEDIAECKARIQKLSSRFAQINVSLPPALEFFERTKSMSELEFPVGKGVELWVFWKQINEQLTSLTVADL